MMNVAISLSLALTCVMEILPAGLSPRGEVSTFLQLFLASKGFNVGERKITSHSLKHTGLSWVGKYGMSKEDQCILGHHSDSVRGTEAVYSYDLSIGSVQRFEVLLHYIASGEFVPDEPRSKFWKFPPAECVPEPATPAVLGSDERLPEVDEFLEATPSAWRSKSQPILCARGV